MVQLAFPLASVVPLQDCEPMVKVTTSLGSGVPDVGVLEVSVPDSVIGEPLTAVVGPVYVRELVSGFTVKALDVLSEPIGVVCGLSPENDAVNV